MTAELCNRFERQSFNDELTPKVGGQCVDLTSYLKTCAEKKDGDDINFKTVVTVGLISRYLRNDLISQTRFNDSNFLYDVICTDNSLIRFKALIDPKYNDLIQRNLLKLGSKICVMHAVVKEEHYNTERFTKNLKFIHILELEIVGVADEFVNLDALLEPPDWNFHLCDIIYPLSGMRRCYLDIWNDSIPFWPDLQLHDKGYFTMPLAEFEELYKKSQNLLERLHEGLKMCRYDVSQALLLRILSIGNLHHYGRPNDRRLFPYRWNMVVTDGKAVCRLCIWDEAVMKLYGRVIIGSVLLITDYTVCSTKIQWSRFHDLYTDLKWLPVEVKLNASSNAAEDFGEPVHILFPEIDYICSIHREVFNFKSADDIGCLCDDSVVDVVGIITRISRYERSVKRQTRPDGEFMVYYWIEIIDPLMKNIIRLKLSVNSQEYLHRCMEVGQAAIFASMKLKLLSTVGMPWFLKSGIESQIIPLQYDDAEKRYEKLQAVMDVVNSMTSPMLETLEEKACFGGGYFYPPPLPNLGNSSIHILQCEKELNTLMFWQRHEMLVKAQIVEISFVPVNMSEESHVLPISQTFQSGSFSKVCRIFANPNWTQKEGRTLGLSRPHFNTLPHKYSRNQSVSRPDWFPTVENSRKKSTEAPILLEANLQCSGYYHVILSDLQEDIALSCFLIPCCCQGDATTVWERLLGDKVVPHTSTGCVTNCNWREVRQSVDSDNGFSYLQSLESSDTCFLLEAFKHDDENVELILRRMYKQEYVSMEISN